MKKIAIRSIIFDQERIRQIMSGDIWQIRKFARRSEIDAYDPPYKPGDLLYVKEVWSPVYPDTIRYKPCQYVYGADSSRPSITVVKPDKIFNPKDRWAWSLRPEVLYWEGSWYTARSMPKEAARIWLVVKDVKLQKYSEITGRDATAEGFETKAELLQSLRQPHGMQENADFWKITFIPIQGKVLVM